MGKLILKIFMVIYVGLYRLTSGRIGGRLMGNDVLLITTIGRKSGKKRTTPVMYLRDGERYLVTASAGGGDKHPGWYWNAAKGSHPVQIEVKKQKMTVNVEEPEREERDKYYERFKESNPGFATYETKTHRVIPVLVLTPQ
ncbi:MAG: nitroreductase family deazaflavin-dependent oxidoreductase [Chloroflexi bacterium]|nr:nitroreductase family deazaflavin-dependent oxidoreductase [Chloroflexota bacterium]